MKSIPLTQGKFAIVDDQDYGFLMQWKWCARHDKKSDTWYAVSRISGNQRMVPMHRLIMNAPEGMEVDHRDNNGLHNWRGNLRICTGAQNKYNRRPQKANPTGYKGVYLFEGKSWRAKIGFNKKQIHLGTFPTAEAAARAYDAAASKYFGEFAWLNFPNSQHD